MKRRSTEDGFTLIEALMSIMILGVIMSALTTAVVLYFRTNEQTTQKLSESPGLQFASAYFGSDAQANDTALPAMACGSIPALISFRWHDPGTGATATTDDRNFVVSYVLKGAPNTQQELWRYQCVGLSGAPDGLGAPTTIHLVKFVDPTTAPVVSVPGASILLTLCTWSGTTCKDDRVSFALLGTRRKP